MPPCPKVDRDAHSSLGLNAQEALGELFERHRRELLVYCYPSRYQATGTSAARAKLAKRVALSWLS